MSETVYFAIGLLIGLTFLVMVMVSRGKMYIPGHWHAFLPFTVLLATLYIEERLKQFSSAVLLMQLGSIVSWVALEIKGVMYQAHVTGWGSRQAGQPPAPPAEEETVREFPELRPLKRAIIHNNAQVVVTPKINAEQKVAKTLIYQRNHNFQVDLTEDFWIKRHNWDGTPAEFRDMKARWIRQGVSYKTGARKNAPHDIKDWRKVRLIADGHEV